MRWGSVLVSGVVLYLAMAAGCEPMQPPAAEVPVPVGSSANWEH